MHRLSIVVAMSFLAACGGTQGENAAEAGPDVAMNGGEVGNRLGDTAPPAADSVVAAPAGDNASISPCLVQGTDQLDVEPLRAVGTEPFWSARVEGRCVTYSTPEDQQGTRIWTRYAQGAQAWTGQLNGQSFELRTRLAPGCSDGMSDKRYPIAVELMVDGEKRSGCAEEL